MGNRIGPRMKRLVELVEWHPGQTVAWYSRAVGPNGSQRFGSEIVRRTLAASLIRMEPHPTRQGWHVLQPLRAPRQ